MDFIHMVFLLKRTSCPCYSEGGCINEPPTIFPVLVPLGLLMFGYLVWRQREGANQLRLTFRSQEPWLEDRTPYDGTMCGRIGVEGLIPDESSDAELVEMRPSAGLHHVPLEWMHHDKTRGFVNVVNSARGSLFVTHTAQLPHKVTGTRYAFTVRVTVKGQSQTKTLNVALENGRLQMWD